MPAVIERERVAIAAQSAVRRLARSLGWDAVRAGYYSPIVNTEQLPDAVFERAAPMPGVDLDLANHLDLLERRLAPRFAEWDPPLDPPGDELGFYLRNRYYGPFDSYVLYGFVRELRPSRLIELGSGYSTLVIRQAAKRNMREGHRLEHTVIDPHPSPLVGDLYGLRIETRSPTELDGAVFERLQGGDVLFVDTTHVVKAGSEVPRIVLELLPALAGGVVVHFHDIFRPFEYPRVLFERFNVHWQEQYLVQAFLAFNPQFRVLLANHALARLHRDRVARALGGHEVEPAASAFWLERLG
jgi:hypothetical protein